MFLNISKWLIVIILFARIVPGSRITIGRQYKNSARQRKTEEMLKYMNLSADPCMDFYEFACGNYGKYHTVDKDIQPIIGSLDILYLAMETKMKDVLEFKDDASCTKADRKVKSYYRSCLRAPKLQSLYNYKLKNLIEEIGYMPVLKANNWPEAEFDWSETIGKIAYNSGVAIIVHVDIDTDYLNNTINRVYLTEAVPNTKSFYKDNSKKQHDKYINDIAEDLHKFLGVKLDVAVRSAKEIFEFEAALAQGMNDDRSEVQMTQLFPEATIEDLELKYLSVWDVKKFLKLALDYQPRLIYAQLSYLDVVMRVLANTPKHIVANYIFHSYIKKFIYARKESKKGLKKRCMKDTKHYFYKNVDNMIYRQFFTPQMKEVVYSMWQEIKSAFEEALQMPRLGWIQEKTRQYAAQKLKALELRITTYEEVNFDQELNQLQLKDHDYVYNMKSILALRAGQARAKIKQLPKSEEDLGELASFTPLYISAGHFVSIPVSYLQPNFAWSLSFPYAYNFANLGFSIAHELIHAFDDGGRYYDSKGIYHDWWDTVSANAFEERIKCFMNQYKQYSMEGHSLPEMKVQSENIGDNGGVRLAYDAYLRWYIKVSQSSQDQELIVGLNYTKTQMFFISYGQVWCSAVHPDYLLAQLASDTHVPDKFRVIGPLANLEEFSKEFSCPSGSVMNPVTKCRIY